MLDVPRFTLGPSITPDRCAFLREHGFVLFAGVATPDEIAMLGDEMERIEAAWLAEGRKRVFGIPLFFGKDETSEEFLQRLAFTSVFSERVHRCAIPASRRSSTWSGRARARSSAGTR